MPRKIFVSYSQNDRDCAFELVAWMEAQGIGCWIAPRDISPSADWAAEIIDAIAAASVMVLVFSASSNHSPQVRREVERAVHKQIQILPFRIDDVMPSKSLEYFLSAQHWLDAFPPPREPHYARLAAYLSTALSGHPKAQESNAPRMSAVPGAAIHTAPGKVFDESVLRQIEARLAEHIGPLAQHLVKRAAVGAAGMNELVLRLASELDSEPARRQFVAACREIKRSRA